MTSNYGKLHGSHPDQRKPGSRIWRTARLAWEEILLDLPPNFDHDWRTLGWDGKDGFKAAGRNYEIARQAALTLALQGKFPSWRKNGNIPEILTDTFRSISQEMRLGKEMNLPLDLTPTTAAQEDLSHVY